MRNDLEALHAKLTSDAENHMTSSKAHRACTAHERTKLITLAAEKRSIARSLRKILDADAAEDAPTEVRADAAGSAQGVRPEAGQGSGDASALQDGALAGGEGGSAAEGAVVLDVPEREPSHGGDYL